MKTRFERDRPLTSAQRAYLGHFDDYLRARSAPARLNARAGMRNELEHVLAEAPRRPVDQAS